MSSHVLFVTGYATAVAVVVLLEVLGRIRGSRVPTAGELLAYLMRTRIGRVTVLSSWWWLGWHFLAR